MQSNIDVERNVEAQAIAAGLSAVAMFGRRARFRLMALNLLRMITRGRRRRAGGTSVSCHWSFSSNRNAFAFVTNNAE
jgi:hypothetical protein